MSAEYMYRFRVTKRPNLGDLLIEESAKYRLSLQKIWNQSKVKPKPIVTYSHVSSRAWRRLHVLTSSSGWFIGLSASLVIGQSNYFGFGFTTLI